MTAARKPTGESVFIEAIGVCAGGMPDWRAARGVLRDEAQFIPAPAPRFAASTLPATERRRANETSRWALQAAGAAVDGLEPARVAALATVFASADGDGDVLAQVLRDLAEDKVALSPTTFHNSVFNAPGGYWSIAALAPAASTTLCAGGASFAAGLLEAAAQVRWTRAPVLLVAYDHPFPDESPIATSARAAFACALLLAPVRTAAGLGRIDRLSVRARPVSALPQPLASCFAGNAAAASLRLLHAVAREQPLHVALPYIDDNAVSLTWTPCD